MCHLSVAGALLLSRIASFTLAVATTAILARSLAHAFPGLHSRAGFE